MDLLREVQDKDDRKRLFADWVRAQHASRIEGTLTLARTEPGIPVTIVDLDADPWLLNLVNGTLDLRARELRVHDRVDRITKLAPVRYDADANAPKFHKFLARVLPKADVRGYVQRVLGISGCRVGADQVVAPLRDLGFRLNEVERRDLSGVDAHLVLARQLLR